MFQILEICFLSSCLKLLYRLYLYLCMHEKSWDILLVTQTKLIQYLGIVIIRVFKTNGIYPHFGTLDQSKCFLFFVPLYIFSWGTWNLIWRLGTGIWTLEVVANSLIKTKVRFSRSTSSLIPSYFVFYNIFCFIIFCSLYDTLCGTACITNKMHV